jgi:hypothetical protein
MPDTPLPRRPSPRRLFAIAVAAAVVGFILTLSFGYADHAPAPHGVRVAVAAPATLGHELTTGLAHAVPGGFTVVAAPSARAVIDRVLSQSAAGGLVTGATGPVTIVTASGGSSSAVSPSVPGPGISRIRSATRCGSRSACRSAMSQTDSRSGWPP